MFPIYKLVPTSVPLKRFENTKIPPFCFSHNQLQRGWKNRGKIEIPRKSEAHQQNFQQIAATEPYSLFTLRGWFGVSSHKVTGEFEARQDQ